MRTHRQQASTSQPVDRTMLWTLKRRGSTDHGRDLVIDRDRMGSGLSVGGPPEPDRQGVVNPVRPCEYRISIAGLLRR